MVLSVLLAGCTGLPAGVAPVGDFVLDRYLGKWYEIARLDHSFERGWIEFPLSTPERGWRCSGGKQRIQCRNRRVERGDWQNLLCGGKGLRAFKVSFWALYGSYVVFGLDRDHYQYAFVSGPNTSYLWLLSRTPQVSEEVISEFKRTSGQRGFDTSSLIFVNHTEGRLGAKRRRGQEAGALAL